MTRITTGTGRDGNTYWAVRRAPGDTQLAICLSEAEAAEVARPHRPAGGARWQRAATLETGSAEAESTIGGE